MRATGSSRGRRFSRISPAPAPRRRRPAPSLVAASRDDPLGAFERVAQLAADWGSKLVDLGQVGHLNPASGYGDWPMAKSLIAAQGWSCHI